jgi:hypothetical protein
MVNGSSLIVANREISENTIGDFLDQERFENIFGQLLILPSIFAGEILSANALNQIFFLPGMPRTRIVLLAYKW